MAHLSPPHLLVLSVRGRSSLLRSQSDTGADVQVANALCSFGDEQLFSLIWRAVLSRAADLMRTLAHSAEPDALPVAHADIYAVRTLLSDVGMYARQAVSLDPLDASARLHPALCAQSGLD